MRWHTLDDVAETLNEAINGKICVEAWLGCAAVLFIGFGERVLLDTSSGESPSAPPYKLETGYADWRVEDATHKATASTDEREEAELAVASLIGLTASGWRFLQSAPALEIVFDDGATLTINPYADGGGLDKDAWILRTRRWCGVVNWDGTVEVLPMRRSSL